MKKTPDFDGAAAFMAGHARVVDRRLFQRLFSDGAAGPVRDAVAAYRNSDGGFGFALEPDCRAAASQPAAVEMALRLLDFADEWDSRLVSDAVDWLAGSPRPRAGPRSSSLLWPRDRTRPGGCRRKGIRPRSSRPARSRGAVRARVRAPVAGPRHRGDVVAHRHAHRAERVRDVRRARVPPARAGPVRAPRRRSRGSGRCCSRAGWSRSTRRPGEAHSPLEFAPLPSSLARGLFSEATIEAHLDHLAGGQRDDGGWTFNWPSWSPAAEADWRGFLTVDNLRILRANGRA